MSLSDELRERITLLPRFKSADGGECVNLAAVLLLVGELQQRRAQKSLPPPLQSAVDLFREDPAAWHAEHQRSHAFKAGLLAEQRRAQEPQGWQAYEHAVTLLKDIVTDADLEFLRAMTNARKALGLKRGDEFQDGDDEAALRANGMLDDVDPLPSPFASQGRDDMKHIFPMDGRPPCKECGASDAVELNVSSTGYSVTSRHQHKPECPTLFCPHGVRWHEDCATCEAEQRESCDE